MALIYICVEIRRAGASRWILLARRANAGLSAGIASARYGWIFLPTVTLAVIAGAAALAWLRESRAHEGRHLDWPGQITGALAIAGSIYGVIEGGSKGWSAPVTIAGLWVGAAAFAAFIMAERRSDSPLLNLT